MLEDFTGATASDWTYLSDQVMGGVSQGQAQVDRDGSVPFIHLAGTVSTENRGGFIQVRRLLPNGLPDDTAALTLTARGHNGPYFLHLRTTGTRLPWQYYQAEFPVTADWDSVTIPLSAFKPSGRLLRQSVRPADIRSIGIVAYGRDHQADVSVAAIELR